MYKFVGDFGGLLPNADSKKRPGRGSRKISLQMGTRCRRSSASTWSSVARRPFHVFPGSLRRCRRSFSFQCLSCIASTYRTNIRGLCELSSYDPLLMYYGLQVPSDFDHSLIMLRCCNAHFSENYY